MLRDFVILNRDEIIARCRARVASRSASSTVRAGIDHGVPMFLDQLLLELGVGATPGEQITRTATLHGRDLFRQGFAVGQVVQDYGDVCQVITQMVMERKMLLTPTDFRVLNRCLDDAIAGAVTEYGRARDDSIASDALRHEQVLTLARALRVSIYTASVAFGVLKSGRVGIVGSTGVLVEGSLSDAQDLVDQLIGDAPDANPAPGTDSISQPGVSSQ